MATKFVGQNSLHNVVVFGNLRIWAERGLIHVEDATDNSYSSFSVQTMLHRIAGINAMVKNSLPHLRQKHSHDQLDNIWLENNQKMIEQMIEVINQAKEQGMPSDASARRDAVRRRPKTIIVPGTSNSM